MKAKSNRTGDDSAAGKMETAARMEKGVLIAGEGIDGAGKSTHMKILAEFLAQGGREVVQLREPTQGFWGQKIRKLLTEGRDGVSPEEELEWFINDRREDVEQNIRPALDRGAVVVIDRYYYSTAAYQGALGFDPQAIIRDNEAFAPRPDLVLLFHIDPEEGLKRISASREGFSSFEKLEYLKKVQAHFESFSGPHIKRVEAGRTMEEVAEDVREKVTGLMAQRSV